MFLTWAPRRRLLAETSGKNSIIVSATADVDQAVRDVVMSAFGHAGQKCSAASLAIVVGPVYDSSPFLRQLADAVKSLRTGPATEPASQVGPVVGPFTKALERALTRLGPGESWLVEPACMDLEPNGNGYRGTDGKSPLVVWRRAVLVPGRKDGRKTGLVGAYHRVVRPVLGVMRAASFEEAVSWQNAVPYGLTAGLSSLDPAEHRRWAEAVEAGNLYVNRSTTGAVVGRQPFGGWKRSSVGPTAKAGGPNYLIGLRRWRDSSAVGRKRRGPVIGAGGAALWAVHGAGRAGLRVERAPLPRLSPGVIVRADDSVTDDELRKAAELSRLTGTPVSVLAPADPAGVRPRRARWLSWKAGKRLPPPLAAAKDTRRRLRLLGDVEDVVLEAGAEAGLTCLMSPFARVAGSSCPVAARAGR